MQRVSSLVAIYPLVQFKPTKVFKKINKVRK